MEKRLFEVLDALNLKDIENDTAFVRVGSNIVSVDHKKKGLHITMGVDHESTTIDKLLEGETLAVLLLVDAKEYKKAKKEAAE